MADGEVASPAGARVPATGSVPPAGVRVPDFFIVGQPKAGTTAMYEMLRQHPQIYMPRSKEPQYLSHDLRRRFKPARAGNLPETLDAYLALFADAAPDQIAGEASSAYLLSEVAAAGIAELNPSARVIAIFREPAAFLRSLHLQLLQDQLENQRSLEKALALEPKRAAGKRIPRRSYRPQVLRYSEHLRYTDQLRRYRDVLPEDQILVLVYEEYRADNAATIERVFDFLGVDTSFEAGPVQANPAIAVRSQNLDNALNRLATGRGTVSHTLKRATKAVLGSSSRRLLVDAYRRVVYAPPPPPDDALMAEIRRRCAPEVERFGEYLGRDLVSLWGYDRV